jgi:hypothetical protein
MLVDSALSLPLESMAERRDDSVGAEGEVVNYGEDPILVSTEKVPISKHFL